MLNEIEKTVNFYVYKTAGFVDNQCEPEDVRQTLYEQAIILQNKYDRSKASFNTYVSKCFNRKMIDLKEASAKEKNLLIYTNFESEIKSFKFDKDSFEDGHSNCFRRFNSIYSSIDEELVKDNEYDKVLCNMLLDDIEKALKKQSSKKMKRALKVFRLMRKGMNAAECSDMLNLSKGYISRLFNECIRPVGQRLVS